MRGIIALAVSGKRKASKGFAVSIQMVVILTVVFLGISLLLGTFRGATPIYYQNMPESKFGNLLMTYEHVKTNIEDVFKENSDRLFLTMGDFPFAWDSEVKVGGKTYKSWSEISRISDEEWKQLYQGKFASATESYLGSVKNLGFEWIEIKSGESKVDYDSSGSKMTWTFVYSIKMKNNLPQQGVYNSIDTTQAAVSEYANFINLEDARACAKEFFGALPESGNKFTFGEENADTVRKGIEQKLNQIKPSACQSFDISAGVSGEISCGGKTCSGGSMKPVPFTLFIEGKSGAGPANGAISFSGKFSNFGKGTSSSLKCSTGSDCGGDMDCVDGVCGSCMSELEGAACSPAGTAGMMSSYECYKGYNADAEVYKCLPRGESMWITNGDSQVDDKGTISLNCALGEKKWQLKMPAGTSSSSGSVEVMINGVRVPTTSSQGTLYFDLCDIRTVPQANGELEIYQSLSEGNEKYKVFGAGVSFALDACIGGISRKLDGYVYEFSEGTFESLKSGLTNSLTAVIKTAACEGYSVSVSDISLSCKDSCTMTSKTSWDKEVYSKVILEIREKSSSGNIVAKPSYIISYSP